VAEAAASSANLGSGFDVFALALDAPRDKVEVVREGNGRSAVYVREEGGSDLPTEPTKNASGAVALAMAKKHTLNGALYITVKKGVPIGVGLGSSGASSAATALALDKLYSLGLDQSSLVTFAGEGERATSGAAHLDNVTASIMGGFVIVPQDGLKPLRLAPPPGLELAVATPQVTLPPRKTEYARGLLPTKVDLASLVFNVSRASRVAAGFAKWDVGMIGQGMEDSVVEPARAPMIPGLDKVRMAAKEAGASGCCISGAGPSVLSLLDSKAGDSKTVLRAMVKAFEGAGMKAHGFTTTVGKGARVPDSS